MKLVDFHTHFFPDRLFEAIWRWFETRSWPIHYKKYADDLIACLKKEGVTHAVSLHYPHKKGMARSLNEFAYQLGRKYPGFLIPFGSLHPDDDDKEEILKECFENFGFKGIKIHCHVQKVAPNDRRMEPIYNICGKYKKIILIHCGTGPNFKANPAGAYGYDVTKITGVRLFEKVLQKFPATPFVVPHMGYEEIESFVNLLPHHPYLYLDTTMVLSEFFPVDFRKEWLLTYPDRFLFGTDFPNIPHEWKKEKVKIQSLNLGKEVENQIFYTNAAQLLGIE